MTQSGVTVTVDLSGLTRGTHSVPADAAVTAAGSPVFTIDEYSVSVEIN
jgi:hypothetical protein